MPTLEQIAFICVRLMFVQSWIKPRFARLPRRNYFLKESRLRPTLSKEMLGG
jgi:hypothetical protein